MGPDPVAARDRLRHSGRGTISALERGEKHRACAATGPLAGRPNSRASEGDARVGRSSSCRVRLAPPSRTFGRAKTASGSGEGGSTLSTAMRQYDKVFDALYVNLV